MRIFYLITLLLCLSSTMYAQDVKIHGQIHDDLGEPLPFATVVLRTASDSLLVKGTTTNEYGVYEFFIGTPGKYHLQYSSMGFKTVTGPEFSLEGYEEIDLGVLILEEENYALEEVVVKSLRPRVISRGGNLTVNIEDSALASGSSIYEVVEQSPGVTTDMKGEFSLNGKSGVRIYVNDRPLYLEGEDLQSYLQGLPSESLKSIELITNPSSRYDAEGTGAIINLQLKESRNEGLSGSFNAGSSYNEVHGFTAGTNLYHKRGKWNSRASFSLNRNGFIRYQNTSKSFYTGAEPQALLTHEAEDERIRFTPSLNLGTEIALNENHTLGFSGVLTYQEKDVQWDSYGSMIDYEQEENFWIDARNNENATKRFATSNFYYSWEIDSLGTRLDLNADLIGIGHRGGSSFANIFEEQQGMSNDEELLFSDVRTDFQIYSITADLSLPLGKKTRFELGTKGSRVISKNQLDFYIASNGIREMDPERSNAFTYREDILAAYAALDYKIGENITLKTGMRVENTSGSGIAQDNSRFSRQYLEWFPQLSLEHSVSDNYQVNYAYQRRIRRPRYMELNPFVFYIDPYSYILGKPDLAPQFTHVYQLNQTFFNKYVLNLSYNQARNFIGEVPYQNSETRETVFSISNLDEYRQTSLTAIVPVKFSQAWQSTNNIGLVNTEYRLLTEEAELANTRTHWYFNTSQTLQLSENTLLEALLDYRSPTVYGMYRFGAMYGMDLAVKRSVLKDRLDITLRLNDVFRTRYLPGYATLNGNQLTINQYMGAQQISVNARYKFRGFNEAQRKKKRELEELSRAGG